MTKRTSTKTNREKKKKRKEIEVRVIVFGGIGSDLLVSSTNNYWKAYGKLAVSAFTPILLIALGWLLIASKNREPIADEKTARLLNSGATSSWHD